MTKLITNNLNMIAKGHNNFAGLTNIELIAVGGNTPSAYLETVNDLGLWQDGQSRVTGDGIARDDGFSSTGWHVGALAYAQRTYLKHSILGGKRSGPVTVKTRRDEVPIDDTMSYRYIIANAIMMLAPLPRENKYLAGINNFIYRFDRIEILHEDKMKGTLSVTGASTAQDNIDATPEKLTAFTTSGLNDGVTTSASGDSHEIVLADDYKSIATIDFTATASTIWTFQFYVNAAAVGVKFLGTTNATPDAVQVVMQWPQAMDAEDVVTIYVNSNDGGGTADITITEAVFTVESF